MNLIRTLEEAGNAAARANPEAEGDYIGETGLLYCGLCHTPKQWRGELPVLGEVIQAASCKCQSEKLRREQEQRTRQKLRDMAFDTPAMQKWDFAHDDGKNPDLTAAMRKYAALFATQSTEEVPGLLLHGGVGGGKTYAAAEVVNALVDMGFSCRMTSFARIAGDLQNLRDRNTYIQDLNRCRLLVLDDLGAERETAYMGEIVFQVIDTRIRTGLPLIVTTNLTIEDIKNPATLGNSRIYDRLIEKCHPIEVQGTSRRRKEAAARYPEMRGYLGM